jgi:hypothetical protein
MDHQKFGNYSEIAAALIAAAGLTFLWLQIRDISRQVTDATTQIRFSVVSQYAELTHACRDKDAPNPPARAEALQIQWWNNLCEARILSHEIIINDLLRAASPTEESLVNLEAAHKISIQLEDGLVRELLLQAKSFLVSKRELCSYSDSELLRVQEIFRSVYLFDKPRSSFQHERESHQKDLADEPTSEHTLAFLDFANATDQIANSCVPKHDQRQSASPDSSPSAIPNTNPRT